MLPSLQPSRPKVFSGRPLYESVLMRRSYHNNPRNQATNNGAWRTSFNNLCNNLCNNHNSSWHTARQSYNSLARRLKPCLLLVRRHRYLHRTSMMLPSGIQCSSRTICGSRHLPYRNCRAKGGIRWQTAIYKNEVLLVLFHGPSCKLSTQARLKAASTQSPPSVTMTTHNQGATDKSEESGSQRTVAQEASAYRVSGYVRCAGVSTNNCN